MKSLKKIVRFIGFHFKFVLLSLGVLHLSLLPQPVWAGKCEDAQKKVEQVCVADPSKMTGDMGEVKKSMNQDGDNLSGQAGGGALANAAVCGECAEAGNACIQACTEEAQSKTPPDAALIEIGNKCKATADTLAGQYCQQAGNMTEDSGQAADTSSAAQGGGLGNMGKALLGAGAAVGALCLMGQLEFCKKDDEEKDKKDKDGAKVSDKGKDVNCLEDKGAFKNPDCEDDYLNLCMSAPTAKNCDKFSKLYCNLSGASEEVEETTSVKGSGVGSFYCQITVATQFCEGSSDRDTCPSCTNLSRMKSEACKDNMSVCLPQMTTEDLDMAKVVCPTDPIFSNPHFAENNVLGVPEGDGVTGKASASSEGTNSYQSGSYSGPGVTSSPSSAQRNHRGLYGSAKDVASGGKALGASGAAGAGLKDAASSGEGGNSYGTSARLNRQIASEVAPSLGPGLFARHTALVEKRCRAGQINKCGPRKYGSTVSQ